MSKRSEKIRRHFDALSADIGQWRRRNYHYHQEQSNYFRYLIAENMRVLELGSGNGDLLNALCPSYGRGLDISPGMVEVARKKYPHLSFDVADADNLDAFPSETFDYIILSDLVGYLQDIQMTFESLHKFCNSHTRIILSYHNFLWEPLLNLAERVRLKMPTPEQSWLSLDDLRNLFFLANMQVVKIERRQLFPKYIPLVTAVLNHIGTLPFLNKLCLCHYVVARPIPSRPSTSEFTASVIIPCRNEKGNIEPAVRRMPCFAKNQELIFVDGHSSDGTQEEIQRMITTHTEFDIKLLIQDGTGKGDAVRKGFLAARGDILFILDADLTVPPEDLPKFYRAITTGKGEFLNGSRLVYPMEVEAMRILNLMANKLFAMLFTWLLGDRLKDTLCGTKVISRDNYQKLSKNRAYFGNFDPFGDFDLLFGASKMNLKIIEIPVRYRNRKYGETKIKRFSHGWLLLRMVVYAYRKLKSV